MYKLNNNYYDTYINLLIYTIEDLFYITSTEKKNETKFIFF